MTNKSPTAWRARPGALLLAGALSLGGQIGYSQEQQEEEEIYELSPFEVDASDDKGYRATNAISGTRLNAAIKDTPLPIEAITNEFMRDIGATNLREALQYSAGIILNSQNDALVDYQTTIDREPGSSGANSPGGSTSSSTGTSVKLRGFVIDQVLREGFRRQHSADWINIERVEVVRGPQALLYGVGSFGGVINYVTKKPMPHEEAYTSLSIGSHNHFRTEFDYNKPLISGERELGFRVTGAYQENGDETEFYNNKQYFISPTFSYKPWANGEILFENEFGYQKEEGIGFMSIRDSSAGSSGAVQRGGTFITDDRVEPRRFRWSGPDTWRDADTRNHIIDLKQSVGEDLHLNIGYAYSHVRRSGRNINSTGMATGEFAPDNPKHYYNDVMLTFGQDEMSLVNALNNPPAGFTKQDIIDMAPAGSFRGDRLFGEVPGLSIAELFSNQINPNANPIPLPTDQTVIRYNWRDSTFSQTREQIRAEANYELDFFGRHNFLLGTQYMKTEGEGVGFGAATSHSGIFIPNEDAYSYKNPEDLSYFRFGEQGDGLPDPIMVKRDGRESMSWDLGYYLAYHGRFFNERLNIMGGYRWDRNDTRNTDHNYLEGTSNTVDRADFSEEAPSKYSPQLGASFAVTKDLTVFAAYSTGHLPNYDQLDGNGIANPTDAKSYEAGIKFDLFESKLSGTLSAYKIERENTPRNIWWAPAPYKSVEDPTDPNKPLATVWGWKGPEGVWWSMKQLGDDGLRIAKEVFPSGYHAALEKMAQVPAGDSEFYPDSSHPLWGWWDDNPETPAYWWGTEGLANNNTYNLDDDSGLYFPLVNLDNPEHFAFSEWAFKWAAAEYSGNTWPGQFYGYDNGTQLRYGDGAVGTVNAPSWNGAAVPINDEAKGYDLQLIATPLDNWQIVFNFAHVEREITSRTYQYVKAPYFPFAMWFYPQYSWGTLNGSAPDTAYDDWQDTSTYNVQINEYGQSLDDSAENEARIWSRYSFIDGPLNGFAVGLGASWVDKRQWYSGFNVDGTAITAQNPDGERVFVQYWTEPRTNIDAMLEYSTTLGEDMDLRIALNVYNLADDTDLYGYEYARGRSFRLSSSLRF